MRLRHRRRLARIAEVTFPHPTSTTTILAFLALSLLSLGSPAGAQTSCSMPQRRLSDGGSLVFYNGDMTIRNLFDGSQFIGHTIWFRRASNNIHAKFFASGDVYKRYLEFDRQPNERTLLVSVGGFTWRMQDSSLAPDGLTIDNGSVVNRVMDPKMDGLVIVYPDGGIAVSDIKRDWLTVSSGGNPLRLDISTFSDRETFIQWAIANNATVFQTQLLASNKGILLDPCKARKEYRERRFLAIVKERNTGEVIHVIVDVPQSYYLGDLTSLVYYYLEASTDVYGLYNIDVGDYDICKSWDPNGRLLDSCNGSKAISGATNLIVYYFQHQ